MRNIFALFIAILFSVGLGSCKKEKPAEQPILERKVFYAASLIPIKLDMDKNFKGTVSFRASDVSYFIMLDDQFANINLNLINNAIKEGKLIKLHMYKGSLEIAKIEWD